MVRKEPRFGMLGCWIFMPEDWNETVARKNVIEIGGIRVFRCVEIQGHSFLARKDYLARYRYPADHGLPVDRVRMSLDGLVSGYSLPLLHAHNMDDPRSPHNVKTKSGPLREDSALTARKRGFTSAEDYAAWIAADARHRQERPFARQLMWRRLQRDRSLVGRAKRKLLKMFMSEGGK
jgi:hypothetical protein